MKITDLLWQQILHWRARYNVGPSDLRIILTHQDNQQLLAELAPNSNGLLSTTGAPLDSFQGVEILVVRDINTPMVVMIPHEFEATLIS